MLKKGEEQREGADLEGVLPADVVVHRQHGYVETGQENASQNSLFLVIYKKTHMDTPYTP